MYGLRRRTPIKDQQVEALLFQRRAVLAFVVILVVFAVLLARARGSQAGRLREHAAGVVVAPQRGGAVLTLGARF